MFGAAAWVLAWSLLYAPVLIKLAHDWRTDATYSHGFIVPVIALALAWRQRERLKRAAVAPSSSGLLILAFGLALFAIGTAGAADRRAARSGRPAPAP
jgi:hypothetical protein